MKILRIWDLTRRCNQQEVQANIIAFHHSVHCFVYSLVGLNIWSQEVVHRRPYTYCDFEKESSQNVTFFSPVPPSLEKSSLVLPHTESFDAHTNKTWISVYPKGMWRSELSIVCMPREYNLPCVFFSSLFLPPCPHPLSLHHSLKIFCTPANHFLPFLSFFTSLLSSSSWFGFHPPALPLSSCYRLPCRKPRRVCQPDFYYNHQVCQCIPNFMRTEWN